MEPGSIIQYVSLGILLLLSAFFSGTETAFFSLSSLERETLRSHSPAALRTVLASILSSQEVFLISILTGNMLVNVFSSAIGEIIGSRIFAGSSEFLSIILMTLILLVVGEMTPKNIAVRHALEISRLAALPLFFVHRILSPVRWVLQRVTGAVMSIFPKDFDEDGGGRHMRVLSAVQLGYRRNMLDASELHLFESYFTFRDKNSDEVMVPRNQLSGIPSTTTIKELLTQIDDSSVPRIGSYVLVVQEDMDHLLGYVRVTDLLPYRHGKINGTRVTSLLREFHPVPETKETSALMVEMREKNAEIALLVDEYGGTAGIVTFQHLIEDLLGFFYPARNGEVRRVGERIYKLPGSYPVDRLENLFGQEIETDSNTVAGLVLDALGEIPEVGMTVETQGLVVTIRKVDGNAVEEVEVTSKE